MKLVLGNQPAFTRVRPDWWSWDGPWVVLVRGQQQSQGVSQGPEVSRAVVEDLGRMGQDGEATGTLPHRLGGAAPRCPSRYSGE